MPYDAASASPLARVRALLAQTGCQAVVATRPATVAWLTGGANIPIDRTAGVDVVWAVVTPSRLALVTTDVEHGRLLAETTDETEGCEVVGVPWWDEQAMVSATADIAGLAASRLAADGHPAFGFDADHELTRARLALSPPEQDRLRSLGRDAADALQAALRSWTPGETDHEIQSRIVAALERSGTDTPVVIVGGDDRVRRFRHPVAVGAPVRRLVMAVVVARRRGLHVAATRMAVTRGADPCLADLVAQARRVEAATLAATVPGRTYGDALDALDAAYADAGLAGEWRKHYQGGPIGYRQREFEIAPAQHDSPWWHEPVTEGHAVAWNPSVSGGAKVEDTYLVTAGGHERVTAAPDWPTVETDAAPIPGILEVH